MSEEISEQGFVHFISPFETLEVEPLTRTEMPRKKIHITLTYSNLYNPTVQYIIMSAIHEQEGPNAPMRLKPIGPETFYLELESLPPEEKATLISHQVQIKEVDI